LNTGAIPALRAHCRAAEDNLWHFCRNADAGSPVFEQLGTQMRRIATLEPSGRRKQAWMVNATVIC
jgi:hypothetical protein